MRGEGGGRSGKERDSNPLDQECWKQVEIFGVR
jgi:hypothetical protein